MPFFTEIVVDTQEVDDPIHSGVPRGGILIVAAGGDDDFLVIEIATDRNPISGKIIVPLVAKKVLVTFMSQ